MAAVAEHAFHVLAQFLTLGERLVKLVNDILLLGRQLVGMLGVNGREVGVKQFIFLALDFDDAFLQVHLVHEQAVLHVKVRVTLDGSGLKLELDDADGFVHLCNELGGAGAFGVLGTAVLGNETGARVAGIGVDGKGRQRQQVDAVAVLQHPVVAIAQGDAQHVGDAAVVAGGGAHPQDVVVTPLDIKVMEVAQDVHNLVGAGTAVIHVTQQVQHVDGQLLNQVAHGDDELIDTVRRDNGLDNHIDVGLLVRVAAVLVHQLLDDIGKVLGKRLVDLGAAVL